MSGKWIVRFGPDAATRFRLVCLPHAGGGTTTYRQWPALLPSWLGVMAVRLPARESRLRDPPATDLLAIVEALLQEGWYGANGLSGRLSGPFALFGHSMGAVFCFELARALRRRGLPGPAHLFVSGRCAPQVPDTALRISHLADDEFLLAVSSLGGIPRTVLDAPGLAEVVLPAMRADFTIAETYACAPEEPLDCPISAFGGIDDPSTTAAQIAAWRAQTAGPFQLRMMPGGHFFIHTARDELLAAIAGDLGAHSSR